MLSTGCRENRVRRNMVNDLASSLKRSKMGVSRDFRQGCKRSPGEGQKAVVTDLQKSVLKGVDRRSGLGASRIDHLVGG